MEEELFCKYLRQSLNHISRDKYNSLRRATKSDKIIRTLNLCYPFYLKKHSEFKFFAKLCNKLIIANNYGILNILIIFVSVILVIIAIAHNPEILLSSKVNTKTDLLSSILGNLFAFGMTTLILALIIKLLISWANRFFRFLVYFFAPKEWNSKQCSS